jgi:hypothetical protein
LRLKSYIYEIQKENNFTQLFANFAGSLESMLIAMETSEKISAFDYMTMITL